MKKNIFLILFVFFISCNKKNILSKEFNCNKTYSNMSLKTFKDFKNNFTVLIPKKWKTKYYYDNDMSSIYTADTTLNLTKTILIDFSHILNPLKFDNSFAKKNELYNKKNGLKIIKSKKISFLNQPSYYYLSKGKKGKYSYHLLNIFSKTSTGFLQIKTEVYGDSLINKRLCKAIHIINKIKKN